MIDRSELNETRRELYKDPKMEALFDLFSAKEKIKPKFDLSDGYTYPDLDKIMPENAGENREQILEKMVSAKVLDKELYDIELRCPKCKSPDVATRYLCPFCESMRIAKNHLVEHINCGKTSTISSLHEKSWFDFCPSCNKKYSEGEYRIVGKWFECSTCGKQIKNPLITHVCRACDNMFLFDDAIQREVYFYSLNNTAKDEVETGVLFPSDIKKILTDAGCSIKVSNVIKGKSEIEHKFDYVFSDKKKTMAIDTIFSAEPIQEIEMIKEQAKFYDTGIEIYVIVTPKLSEQASMIAKASRFKIVEASNKKDALVGLKKLMIDRFKDSQ